MLITFDITGLCRHEIGGLRAKVANLHVIVEDGLGVVRHHGQQVTFEYHLSVVEVEAADLRKKLFLNEGH